MANKRTVQGLKGNAVIGQSGGPTAVINQSLVGVIEGLKGVAGVKHIYGMRHGVRGLTRSPVELVDLRKLTAARLATIARTPGAALGSTRDKPDDAYGVKIVEACREKGIRYFFYIGGNDSSDTCRIVSELAARSGHQMRCFHVPKTVDNDLMESDHTPGWASAAKFVATAFVADGLDNASIPGVKINVVMGRHAGFLTAAAALARGDDKDEPDPCKRASPQLIYVPETPFDTERFVADVQRVVNAIGRCQVAVSEGIAGKNGKAVAESLIEGLERDAHGNIQLSGVGGLGDALSALVKKRVTTREGKAVRVRADTLGYLQRCWPEPSAVDAREARGVGKFAAGLAAKGVESGSVAIVRRSAIGKPYKSAFMRVELRDVAGKTRHMPADFLHGDNDVSGKFVKWASPLVGELPEVARL